MGSGTAAEGTHSGDTQRPGCRRGDEELVATALLGVKTSNQRLKQGLCANTHCPCLTSDLLHMAPAVELKLRYSGSGQGVMRRDTALLTLR